jgi:hypothetical protein
MRSLYTVDVENNGSACGPVTAPVFKTGGRRVTPSPVGSTPTRFRQNKGFSRFSRQVAPVQFPASSSTSDAEGGLNAKSPVYIVDQICGMMRRLDRSHLMLRTANTIGSILSVVVITSTFAFSLCSVDEVFVNGRVDHPPKDAKIRVWLIYPKDRRGESGDVTVVDGKFGIPIKFLTESRNPIMNGSFGKCGRRPKAVVVTLTQGDQDHEFDSVFLDFAKDFKTTDSETYTLLSPILLEGSRQDSTSARPSPAPER